MSILSINNFTADKNPSSERTDLNTTSVSATTCTLYPCLKSYVATIQGQIFTEELVSTEDLKPYGDLLSARMLTAGHQGEQVFFPSDLLTVRTPCLVGGQTYTASNLSSAPDSITISRRAFDPASGPVSMTFNGSNAPPEVNITAPRECLYAIETYDWFTAAQDFLKDTLRGTCASRQIYYGSPLPQCGSAFWLETLANMPVRAQENVAAYLDDVAESLTRRFRMGANDDGKGEGAATDVPGVVVMTTVCFDVSWWWLAYPAVLTAVAAVALAWEVERVVSGGETVWKSSILPFLYHRERFVEVDGQGTTVNDEKRGEWGPLLRLEDMDREAERRVVFQE